MIRLPSSINGFTKSVYQPPPPPRKRKRNILIGLLSLQLLFLLLIFPLLFLHFENTKVRQELEASDKMSRLGESVQDRSFIDGLYWSLITPIPLSTNDNCLKPRTGVSWLECRM